MNKAELEPSSELLLKASPEAPCATTILVSQLLHDFKNQLGDVRLSVALKNNLANNILEVADGIAIGDETLQQVGTLAAHPKSAAQSLVMQRRCLCDKLSTYNIEVKRYRKPWQYKLSACVST